MPGVCRLFYATLDFQSRKGPIWCSSQANAIYADGALTDPCRASSRVSHALASFQSRFTVGTETSSPCNVCSLIATNAIHLRVFTMCPLLIDDVDGGQLLRFLKNHRWLGE